jgi:hypothetical protein
MTAHILPSTTKLLRPEFKITHQRKPPSNFSFLSHNASQQPSQHIHHPSTPKNKRESSLLQPTHHLSSSTLIEGEEEVVRAFAKLAKKDRNSLAPELKCLMMAEHTHDSHLMDVKVAASAIEKIRNSDRLAPSYTFSFSKFLSLSWCILSRCGDSQTLLSAYQTCMSEEYPPTVQMLLLYFGTFLHSLNSQYTQA